MNDLLNIHKEGKQDIVSKLYLTTESKLHIQALSNLTDAESLKLPTNGALILCCAVEVFFITDRQLKNSTMHPHSTCKFTESQI